MVLKQINDFGTSNPFYARLWLGISDMAHHALKTKILIDYKYTPSFEFDTKYEPIFNALMACRQAKINVIQQIADYKQRIAQNKIIRFHPGHYEVLETIDAKAKENITSFITNGVMAIKGIQYTLDLFDLDIGNLFQKQDKFDDGIDTFYSSGHHFLATYLKQVRNFWSEKLITRRNELEHHGWTIPEFNYRKATPEKIEVIESMIDGLSISDYTIIMLNRIFSFIENIVVYAIKQKIGGNEAIVEMPPAERNPLAPVRFRIVQKSAVMEWEIRYSENDFCIDMN